MRPPPTLKEIAPLLPPLQVTLEGVPVRLKGKSWLTTVEFEPVQPLAGSVTVTE
jgi:hypothetical protein